MDDEDGIRQMTRKGLQRSGFQVLDAATSTEASRIWMENRGSIDLLITDIALANSEESGLELARRIRAADRDLPILVASGNAPETYSADIADLDPCLALPKPFSLPELISLARDLTGGESEE